jgi:acyl-CoA synthetase (AMP-forming)/AMP-acid ligase II
VANCGTLLDESARRFPGRPALTLGERTLTYAGFAAAVDRLAARLSDLAVGQRVAIIAPNCLALPVALFAVWRVGAVAVPLNPRYREYELSRILRDADVRVIVSVDAYRGYSFAVLLRALLPDLPALRRCLFVDAVGAGGEELAGGPVADAPGLDAAIGAVLYTSGTTGEPRGALVPHAREVIGAASVNEVLDAGAADVAVIVPPLSHAFGLSCFLAQVAAGGHCVFAEVALSMAPLTAAMTHHHCTIVHGSPALFASLLKLPPQDWPPPRIGLVAGSACPGYIIERCDTLGFRLLNLYGSTELGTVTCCRRDDPAGARMTTVGRAMPGNTVRVADGEVQVCSSHAMPGYYLQQGRMAAAFDGAWFRTGDLGEVDTTGRLCITGRAKELIHVAGFNVFPAEIEGFLLRHPDVDRAVVVGVAHPTMGEVPHAFVIARPGAALSPPSLLRYARARIAGYKLPYAIHIVPEIPVLASGKPDRRLLARLAGEELRGR